MKKTTWQTRRDAERRKQQVRKILLYGGIGLGLVALVALAAVLSSRKGSTSGLLGDPVPISSRDHIPSDAPPGPYASNPPAGGPHFDTDFTAGFYQESDLATLPKYPQGYLVHSLEHGYVIFWYNCQAAGASCDALKQAIQQVMTATGQAKLIAFPWADMDVPLAMTSWGRILKFTQPDTETMKQFVLHNRYQAPEPDAP